MANGNAGNDTDTDSSFTDIEIDDGNDFSDSDYGEFLSCFPFFETELSLCP